MPTSPHALVAPSRLLYRPKAGYITQVGLKCKVRPPFDSSKGTIMYEKDIYHWASSSTQKSTCTVEPGTLEDVGKIVHFILVILSAIS